MHHVTDVTNSTTKEPHSGHICTFDISEEDVQLGAYNDLPIPPVESKSSNEYKESGYAASGW